MTAILVVDILAVLITGLVGLRFGRDRRGEGLGIVRGLKGAGLIPLGLQAGVLLLFGAGEMLSGDLSGAGHLIPLATTLLLASLAWVRPVEGGIALLVVGAAGTQEYRGGAASLIMVDPQLVSGCLFLVAGALGWKAAAPPAD